MLKKLTVILAFVPLLLWGQNKTVTGTVTSAGDGMPLPGVTVLVKGTSQGTSTDFDGKYSIKVSEGTVLEFSYVGFTTKEIKVNGGGNSLFINVLLKESAEALSEVVVTALGIKKEEKTLTYAQQKVGADEITKTSDINFASSLTGKTAGIQLQKSSSGAGGSTKIVLRGNKSIVGVSSPLFVIDGIPIFESSNEAGDFFEVRDRSDALSQINPNDIESITVLKGSNAAILYGSQGANGVVMITTKKGKEGKLSGTFSSSVSFEKVMELPKLQYRYGSTGDDQSWSYTKGNYDDSFVKNFFRTGHTTVNSLAITGGTDKNNSYLSYANTIANGVVPSNKYVKNNLTISQNNKYLEGKLKIGAKVMLTDEKTYNKPPAGYYFNPLTGLYLFPRNLKMSDYINYQELDPNRNIMTQKWHVSSDKQQNPYWIVNKNLSSDGVKRMIANINTSYNFTDDLSLKVRGSYDYLQYLYERKLYAGTNTVLAHENGAWKFEDFKSTQLYADAILSYKKKIGDFDINTLFGAVYENKVLKDGFEVDSKQIGLRYANEFNFQNLDKNVFISNSIGGKSVKVGVLGNFELGYQNKLFLDVSARNDWSSTLAFTENSSYFYPSFGATALLDKIFELPDYVSLAKLRSSYAIVANDVPAFITNPINKIDKNGISVNTTKPFTEMKPEEQKSFEIGLDLRLFQSRLGLDVTYYDINTKNQFLNLPAPSGSGYTTYYVNAGHLRNHGLEVTLNAKPVVGEDWNWDTSLNYSFNKNKVISLHEELKGKYSLTDAEGYALYITEGGSFGDIYVSKFVRDEQGRIKINDKGKPMRTSEKEFVGNSQPDFLLGWNNNISYKNWSFSFLIDAKFGGKAVDLTGALLDTYGVSERTAEARDIGSVAINGVDEKGKEISSIDPFLYYSAVGGNREGIVENYVYDATNIRLRQLALSYDFDLSKKGYFFKNMNVSFIANNLFFIYKKAPFDPDLAMNTGNGMQSVSNFTVPTTRNYGVSCKINF